jgi:uncharacterized lipoprotein YmbA
MNQSHYVGPLGLLALLLLPGCALTNKAQSNFPRYFSPALPHVAPLAQRSGVELRLGRVSAGAHLREKMAYRSSTYEVGFYDDLLWTEKPAEYLRRALSQVLFEEQGLRSIVSGAAPVLDVELVSFEELRVPQPAALVRLTFVLRNERTVLLEQTLTVERPLAPGKTPHPPAAVAEALGEALHSMVGQLTTAVLAELLAKSNPAPHIG